nr:T-cell receptor delta chain VDJ junction region [mice, liver, gamma delta T cells, 96BLT-21, Peptide Partial, 17 aa] [Mus sp.]
ALMERANIGGIRATDKL